MLLLKFSIELGRSIYSSPFVFLPHSDNDIDRYNGLNYVISIFVADTSSLKNRSLMFTFTSSSYIITVWVGDPIATSFLEHGGVRWEFGMWAILTPFIYMPLWFLFMYNYRKVERLNKFFLPQSYNSIETLVC
jgi:hypothetical protein